MGREVPFPFLQKLERLESDALYSGILHLAEEIASGRMKPASVNHQGHPLLPNQADIFNYFSDKKSSRFYRPQILDLKTEPNFPGEISETMTSQDESQVLQLIEEVLAAYTGTTEHVDSFLNLVERNLSFIQVADEHDLQDISCSEYSRLLAGLATAIYDFYQEGRISYKELTEQQENFYQEKQFILASFDLSGIQDFIYNIVDKGAAKQLKARSLYLDFMCEYISDSFLRKVDLTRANLLYAGGGHAYFILPNTDKVKQILGQFEKDYNEFLLSQVQTRLYVAFGWVEFAAGDIMIDLGTPESYREVYQVTSQMISQKKISRYDAATLLFLNKGGQSSQKECQICHASGELTDYYVQDVCPMCHSLFLFAQQIGSDYFVISQKGGLPIGPNAFLKGVSEADLPKETIERIYVKNEFKVEKEQATHVFVGDHQYDSIDQYVALSQDSHTGKGIKRLAVLRLDVDDLGAAFMAGFSYQGDGKYSTLT